jgi:uncharacterized protein DUF4832/uncharacterized protein DUF4874
MDAVRRAAPALAVTLAIGVVAALPVGCGGASPPTTTITFPFSAARMMNPERGFMVDLDLVAGRDFAYVREQGCTLAYAGVRLDAYRTSPLPPELLEQLTAGFEAVRNAGIKVVLRFVYNDDAHGMDATKWQILAHIAQLTPVLTANADVIAVMDAGFIGAWGEWHSSTNGLENQRDRGDILYAILAALPPSRSVTLRSPMYKADAYGGPLAAEHAHDGSAPSRVGHHNSCFLASDSDLGTYAPPIDKWKEFLETESRYTPVGGETCLLNPPRSDCATAVSELARFHWSFLNALYHADVVARWKSQGCYEKIDRDLGYRLELTRASFDERVAPGELLDVTLEITNIGNAAMFNARPVYLTLDGAPFPVDTDPRRWQPSVTATVRARVPIPADARPGRHRLGLWMPDADPRLRTPERVGNYSVRLTNTDWESPINIVSDAVLVVERSPGGPAPAPAR